MLVSKRKRETEMWTVFVKNTGEVVKSEFSCEVDAMMWLEAQPNHDELAYCPF